MRSTCAGHEREGLGIRQRVVHDDIGRRQQASGTHRQQLRITRTGAHEVHRAHGRRLTDELVDARAPVETFGRLTALVHGAPLVRDLRRDLCQPDRQRVAYSIPQPGRERRALALGRHCDRDRAVPVDRGERERAMLDVVGGVHPHAGGLGVVEHRRVDRSVVGRGDHEAEAGDVAPSVRPALDRDIQSVDASIDLGRDHRHVGSGAEEALDLAQRNPSATNHQAATPGDLQHHGVHRHDVPRPAATAHVALERREEDRVDGDADHEDEEHHGDQTCGIGELAVELQPRRRSRAGWR